MAKQTQLERPQVKTKKPAEKACSSVMDAEPSLLKVITQSLLNQNLAVEHEVVLMSGEIDPSGRKQKGIFVSQNDDVNDAFLRSVLPAFLEVAKREKLVPFPATPSPNRLRARKALANLKADILKDEPKPE